MEKNIDDLLRDLKQDPDGEPKQETNFDENDRLLIKFVLTEKAGLNLRNRVAHGLMDANEYTFDNIVALFLIILKLSKYRFITKE